MERAYTRHTISDAANAGTVVSFAHPTVINHLRMLLWDEDKRSYSYYIEVSVDQKDWVRVIDHSNYFCRSWQNLYFEPTVVQYIKIVGTNSTSSDKVFPIVRLESMHTSQVPPLYSGFIKPIHNVATVELSATVIEGISRLPNALLNGDTEHDWEHGFTCHQIGSGAIVVQLAQPFFLSSLRMLLWDRDDRHYSYYVETSLDYSDWDMAADRTKDVCRAWQVIHFSPRPVSIIRIVGTKNTVNDVFHLVHLECPAQVKDVCENSAAAALQA